MKKIIFMLIVTTLSACHDTRTFESARELKTGMTISEIESIMEKPINYHRLNDSTETRKYVFGVQME